MPGIARKDKQDSIRTNHECDRITYTGTGSNNVFANGIGVVRKGDLTTPHYILEGSEEEAACVIHVVPLTTYSHNVFANGLNVGRKGDYYINEVLITGSNNVFANGG
jgi:uncharacterized Zn-binding protein involved in type VI secretion